MDTVTLESLAELTREALLLLMLLTAPVVGAAVVAGLSVAVVQTATQVQEPTIGFAARAAAVLVALLVGGAWMGGELQGFAESTLALIADAGGAGE